MQSRGVHSRRKSSAAQFLTAPAVEKRYGISRSTLDRWTIDPDVRFPRPMIVRGQRYFSITDLEAWERSSRPEPPDEAKPSDILTIISEPITDYADLMRVLVGRRHDQRLSCAELEHVSGLQPGYVTKLENWNKSYGRNLGPVSMPLLLGGLRVGVVVVDMEPPIDSYPR